MADENGLDGGVNFTHTFSYFYIFLLHTFSLHIFAPLSLYISMQILILNISLDNDRRAVETS